MAWVWFIFLQTERGLGLTDPLRYLRGLLLLRPGAKR